MNLRETFQEQLKTICEVADDALGKKAKTAARNTREKTLCLIERRRRLYKDYLSDRSYTQN